MKSLNTKMSSLYINENTGEVHIKTDSFIEPTEYIIPSKKTYHTPNKEFFNWIYDRLVYVHGEDPDYEYMQSLRERIDDLFGNEKEGK